MSEIYLKRKIDSFLLNWKESKDKLPLIIKGARQIGKTESILHFAKEAKYKSIININFAEEPKYKAILSKGYSAKDVIEEISIIDPSKKFIPHDTLLFFDEITEFPDIATTLKFFKLDNKFDVICSGSMLGTNYKKIQSNSVGYKIDYQMNSLDFEEFLWASGYDSSMIDRILNKMILQEPFSEAEMLTFKNLFMTFSILGGMPAVLKQYIENKSFENSLFTQHQIIQDYKEDIRKYATGLDQTRIMNTFNSIPSQLAKENKKFQISKIEHGARFKDYRGCAEWLNDAGIINICYCLNSVNLPLSGNIDIDKYKLYFSDTGLLISLLDEEAQEDLRANKNLGVYKGAIYENMVADALNKEGYSLYYYKRQDSTLEEDFFIRTAKSLVPLEVKSKDGKSKSLRTLIDSANYPDIRFGIKLSANNIGHEKKIYSFPYFCTFLLKRFIKKFNPIEEQD